MKLVLKGHDERYVVEQSLMNLFPGELPVYEPVQPGDDAWAIISLREDDRCRVTVELFWHGKTAAYSCGCRLTGTDFEKEGQRRYAVATCFYLAFLDLYPKLPEALRAAEKLTLWPSTSAR